MRLEWAQLVPGCALDMAVGVVDGFAELAPVRWGADRGRLAAHRKLSRRVDGTTRTTVRITPPECPRRRFVALPFRAQGRRKAEGRMRGHHLRVHQNLNGFRLTWERIFLGKTIFIAGAFPRSHDAERGMGRM